MVLIVERFLKKIRNCVTAASVTGRPGMVFCFVMIASSAIPLKYNFNDSIFSQSNLFVWPAAVVLAAVTVLFLQGIIEKKSYLDPNLRVFYLALPVILLLVFVSVFVRINNSMRLADEISGRYTSICGVIKTVSAKTENTDSGSTAGSRWTSVDFRSDNGLLIRISGPAEKLRYKARIRITGLFDSPESETNPGCFSNYDYLKSKGIFLTCNLTGQDKIELLREPGFWQPKSWSYGMREYLGTMLDKKLGSEENALLRSLVLGDDELLDQKTKLQFRRAGLSHLTAVSGTHISFIQIPFYFLASLISISRKMRLLSISGLLMLYGFITGWQTGVIRAVIMAIAVLLTRYRNKSGDGLNTLGFAAAIIILIDYNAVIQTGFWLSFMAAAALTGIAESVAIWLEVYFNKLLKFAAGTKITAVISRSLAAAIIIQLVLAPISSKISGEVFLLSWLINLPAMVIAAMICMFAAILWSISTGLNLIVLIAASDLPLRINDIIQNYFAGSLHALLKSLKHLAAVTSSVQYGRIPAAKINIFFWLGFGLLALWIWLKFVIPVNKLIKKTPQSCRSPHRVNKDERLSSKNSGINYSIILCGLLLILVGTVRLMLMQAAEPQWKIYFLDVGQGDAILIHSKNGKSILIDGGPVGSGYYVLLPVMTHLGIKNIDLAVLTHGHEDHAGGLSELLELDMIRKIAFNHTAENYLQKASGAAGPGNKITYNPQQNYESGNPFITRDITAETLRISQDKSIKAEYLSENDMISVDGADFFVLSPSENLSIEQAMKNANDSSLITAMVWNGYNVLFLADMSKDTEKELNDHWIAADVIKVAHHGSRFTTENEFLSKTRPGLAVISVGKNNYGHPSSELIERIEKFNARIMRTDIDGCVLVSLDSSGIFASAYNSPE